MTMTDAVLQAVGSTISHASANSLNDWAGARLPLSLLPPTHEPIISLQIYKVCHFVTLGRIQFGMRQSDSTDLNRGYVLPSTGVFCALVPLSIHQCRFLARDLSDRSICHQPKCLSTTSLSDIPMLSRHTTIAVHHFSFAMSHEKEGDHLKAPIITRGAYLDEDSAVPWRDILPLPSKESRHGFLPYHQEVHNRVVSKRTVTAKSQY